MCRARERERPEHRISSNRRGQESAETRQSSGADIIRDIVCWTRLSDEVIRASRTAVICCPPYAVADHWRELALVDRRRTTPAKARAGSS